MRHIDYGLGGFRATLFDTIPDGEPYDLADVYAGLLSRRELAAYEVADRFYEIGSSAGLEEMRQFAAVNRKG
jgi:NDP-sugar pyrophosphorylase family protein